MNNQITQLSPFEVRATDLNKRATSLKISDQTDIATANSLFKECQETLREVKAKRDEMLAPLEDAVDQIKRLADGVALPIKEAKALIEKKCLDYKAEIERVRREEAEKERKRLEEARLKREAEERARAEEERKKRAAEEARLAEIKRQQDEERRKLEAEQDELRRKEREIEQKRLDEEAKLEKERVEIERQKRENEAEKKRLEEAKLEEERRKDAEIQAKTIEEEAAATKLRGETTYWTYEVVNIEELNPYYLCPDDAKIKAAIKDGDRHIPGLRIYSYTKMK